MKENDLVVFVGRDVNGEIYKVEIGKFKRYNKDKSGAFVYYHSGETAALTDLNDLFPLNNYWFIKTNLGTGDIYK